MAFSIASFLLAFLLVPSCLGAGTAAKAKAKAKAKDPEPVESDSDEEEEEPAEPAPKSKRAQAKAAKAKAKDHKPIESDSDEEEPAKPAPAAFNPPGRVPAKAADEDDEEDDEEDGSDDESEDEDEAEKPKAAEAEPAPAKVRLPASMADCYKEAVQGVGFKGHAEYPGITEAAVVSYCPLCGLPPDFCIWGPSWDKCKPVALEKFPYYYPELAGIDLGDAKQKAQEAVDKSKVKELPGGKKTRAKSPEVFIKKNTRGGRKCVTCIIGLESFGVKPEAVAKLCKKKFACGSAPVKGEQGQPDCVEIQGDFEEEVITLLVENFKEIPRRKVTIAEGGKVKGRK